MYQQEWHSTRNPIIRDVRHIASNLTIRSIFTHRHVSWSTNTPPICIRFQIQLTHSSYGNVRNLTDQSAYYTGKTINHGQTRLKPGTPFQRSKISNNDIRHCHDTTTTKTLNSTTSNKAHHLRSSGINKAANEEYKDTKHKDRLSKLSFLVRSHYSDYKSCATDCTCQKYRKTAPFHLDRE